MNKELIKGLSQLYYADFCETMNAFKNANATTEQNAIDKLSSGDAELAMFYDEYIGRKPRKIGGGGRDMFIGIRSNANKLTLNISYKNDILLKNQELSKTPNPNPHSEYNLFMFEMPIPICLLRDKLNIHIQEQGSASNPAFKTQLIYKKLHESLKTGLIQLHSNMDVELKLCNQKFTITNHDFI